MEKQKSIPAFAAPAVAMRYGSILFCDRPSHNGDLFSRRHPPMSRRHRAKIFAPFAALEGFEDHILSKEIPYVPRRVPDLDELRALNRALLALRLLTRTGTLVRKNNVTACVEFFERCTDENHDAYGIMGLYRTVTDVVQWVDPVSQTLRVGDRIIPFSDVFSITDPTDRLFPDSIGQNKGDACE